MHREGPGLTKMKAAVQPCNAAPLLPPSLVLFLLVTIGPRTMSSTEGGSLEEPRCVVTQRPQPTLTKPGKATCSPAAELDLARGVIRAARCARDAACPSRVVFCARAAR
ncbi:hypothetical protein MTO96_023639 [Rhipicephalus appendiculatus]